jgi:hypothetical protein
MSSDWHVTGAQSVLVYATMYGSIVGWDLRAPGTAWKLENDLKRGKCDIVEVRKISFPTPTEETIPALKTTSAKVPYFHKSANIQNI